MLTIKNFLISTAIIFILSFFYIYMQYFRGSVTHTGSVPKAKSPMILFDFDGVICDSYHDVISVINENAGAYHYRRLEKNPDNYRNMDSNAFFGTMNISKIKLPFLVKVWRKSLEHRMNDMKPFPGMGELISWLKANNIAIGMVTSNSINNVKSFLSKNGIDKFDFIYSGTGIFSKDRIFQDIIGISHNKPENIYYIGDETRDIQAGKKAEINTISVTWGFQTKSVLTPYNPNYVTESPNKLMDVLSGILAKNAGAIQNPKIDGSLYQNKLAEVESS